MPIKITFDTTALIERIEAGVEAALLDVEKNAKRHAPVRKARTTTSRKGGRGSIEEPGARSERFPVRLVSPRGLTSAQQRLRGAIITEGRSLTFRRQVQRGGAEANRRMAQLFRLTSGPDKGKAPSFLIERGSRILGVLRKSDRGGTLRDSIKFMGLERNGSVISGQVKAEAPYAYYVEYGFHHKGGTQVKARPFMRKALHEDVENAFKAGKYFKRG